MALSRGDSVLVQIDGEAYHGWYVGWEPSRGLHRVSARRLRRGSVHKGGPGWVVPLDSIVVAPSDVPDHLGGSRVTP